MVGASPVQNIGAYGMDVSQTLRSVEALDAKEGTIRRFSPQECAFGYRDSRFKHEPDLIVLSVSFALSRIPAPRLGYADLAALIDEGRVLDTPQAIGDAVREIRSKKFPDLAVCGTAGSFFKNPIVSRETHAALAERYGAIPSFPLGDQVKIPLAFILDRVLHLRAFREGNVSLFGNQPLVVVADHGATSEEIDAFATMIAQKVFDETGIRIEREVRNFPAA